MIGRKYYGWTKKKYALMVKMVDFGHGEEQLNQCNKDMLNRQ